MQAERLVMCCAGHRELQKRDFKEVPVSFLNLQVKVISLIRTRRNQIC